MKDETLPYWVNHYICKSYKNVFRKREGGTYAVYSYFSEPHLSTDFVIQSHSFISLGASSWVAHYTCSSIMGEVEGWYVFQMWETHFQTDFLTLNIIQISLFDLHLLITVMLLSIWVDFIRKNFFNM